MLIKVNRKNNEEAYFDLDLDNFSLLEKLARMFIPYSIHPNTPEKVRVTFNTWNWPLMKSVFKGWQIEYYNLPHLKD